MKHNDNLTFPLCLPNVALILHNLYTLQSTLYTTVNTLHTLYTQQSTLFRLYTTDPQYRSVVDRILTESTQSTIHRKKLAVFVLL